MKTLIKKNDKVVVITGKERGKTGKVMRIYPQTGRMLISGLNMVKRHVRPSRDIPQGGVIEKECPIGFSNVMFYCGKCSRGVRLGIKRLPDESRMRFCKRCSLEV